MSSVQPQLQHITRLLQILQVQQQSFSSSHCPSTTPSKEKVAPIYFSSKISITVTEVDNALRDQNLNDIYIHINCTLVKVLTIK